MAKLHPNQPHDEAVAATDRRQESPHCMGTDPTQAQVRRHVDVEATRALWDAKATFWDERMGEGNQFHTQLIHPAVTRLLQVQPGERVLDIACGNGQMARHLAQSGVEVLATDFSAVFLERARARAAGTAYAERITYQLADATNPDELASLGSQYDAVLCLMGMMDMPEIEPLAQALPRLLRPGGRFVFAVQHPAFNSAYVRIQAEQRADGPDLTTSTWLSVHGYAESHTGLGAGMPGEPNAHWYFHRSLSTLLAPFFTAGLRLDGIEEPTFAEPQGTNPLSWSHARGIPPILAARLRWMGDHS